MTLKLKNPKAELLTTEVAKILGVSRASVLAYVAKGQLKARHANGKRHGKTRSPLIFKRAEVERFLAKPPRTLLTTTLRAMPRSIPAANAKRNREKAVATLAATKFSAPFFGNGAKTPHPVASLFVVSVSRDGVELGTVKGTCPQSLGVACEAIVAALSKANP